MVSAATVTPVVRARARTNNEGAFAGSVSSTVSSSLGGRLCGFREIGASTVLASAAVAALIFVNGGVQAEETAAPRRKPNLRMPARTASASVRSQARLPAPWIQP